MMCRQDCANQKPSQGGNDKVNLDVVKRKISGPALAMASLAAHRDGAYGRLPAESPF
jgi:hypothetical protein